MTLSGNNMNKNHVNDISNAADVYVGDNINTTTNVYQIRKGKAMKKKTKNLNKRLNEAFEKIKELNHELDRHKAKDMQTFNDWMMDNNMTKLISGLTHERQLMADAVRNLGLRMGSVSSFLEAVRQRVPKSNDIIKGAEEEIENNPKVKTLNDVQ